MNSCMINEIKRKRKTGHLVFSTLDKNKTKLNHYQTFQVHNKDIGEREKERERNDSTIYSDF